MILFYLVFAFFVLTVFNTMAYNFCEKLELNERATKRMYQMTNVIMVTMLVCSYLRFMNAMI